MSDGKQGLGKIALKRRSIGIEPEPFTTPEQTLRHLSEAHSTPAVDLARVRIPTSLMELLPRETAEAHCLLPLRTQGDSLLVAMADPGNTQVLDELSFVTGKQIVPFVAAECDLQEMISRAYLLQRRGEPYCTGPRFVADSAGELADEEGDATQAADADVFVPAADAGSQDSVDATPSVTEPASDHPPPEIPDLMPQTAAEPQSVSAGATESGREALDAADVQRSIEVDRARAVAQSADGSASDRTGAGQHVLIAEDDAEISRLLQRLLENERYRTSVVSDGEAALEQLKRSGADLLLLDANLPKIHGFEVVRRIRGSRRFARLPIMILTAMHRGWRYAEDLRRTGGVLHYLEKPFDSQRLLVAVAQAIRPGAAADCLPGGSKERLELGLRALKSGDLGSAQEYLEEAAKAAPLAYQAHFHLALLYGKQGRPFDAIVALERTVDLNPSYFVGVKKLAVLYQKAGLEQKSTEMWERALLLAPDESTRESIREHVRRLF